MPDKLEFFVRAGTHNDSTRDLAAATMGEADGYREDDNILVAAVKSAPSSPFETEDTWALHLPKWFLN